MPEKVVRDHLPLKQGLRSNKPLVQLVSSLIVRDHLPLKQGLRLLTLVLLRKIAFGQRPSSIKTRIKTARYPFSTGAATARQRPSSITTRIRTCRPCRFPCRSCRVRNHYPLKQGLRLGNVFRPLVHFDAMSEAIFHYNKD